MYSINYSHTGGSKFDHTGSWKQIRCFIIYQGKPLLCTKPIKMQLKQILQSTVPLVRRALPSNTTILIVYLNKLFQIILHFNLNCFKGKEIS